MGEVIAALFGLILGVVVLGYAYLVYREVKALPEGNDTMKEISASIHEGAMVFLNREYRIIGVFIVIVFILLGIFIGWKAAIAYLGGAIWGANRATEAKSNRSMNPMIADGFLKIRYNVNLSSRIRGWGWIIVKEVPFCLS